MPDKYNKYPERKSKDNTPYGELEAQPWKSESLSDQQVKALRLQVQEEYKQAKDSLLPKITVWQKRLKLFNNQRRSEKKVGEPLMFTIFQTVLASLYNDKLEVQFVGREEGDNEQADNLTSMADFDYDEMEKAAVDYEWDWNTCFFGRGLVLMNEFDRRKLHPVPEVLDPLVFLRDPVATSVNGLNGRGAMRFGGNHLFMTKMQMEANGSFINLSDIDREVDKESTIGVNEIDDIADEARKARAEAGGRQLDIFDQSSGSGDNKEYKILRWFTNFEGYKAVVFFSNSWQLVRFHYLVDDEGQSYQKWPIIDRPLYPMSNDWDGVSIPDLTEDKQRMMSIVENLIVEGEISRVYPMHIYDKQRIKNPNDLSFEFNKFIGVDGNPNNAVVPMQKDNPNSVMVDYILRMLDNSAQKATATPEIQQGRTGNDARTLGELNLVASKVDTRNSLTLKIFGWSEKEFWRWWFYTYKVHFDEHIDEKVIRLAGAYGAKWRTLQRENIVSKNDPDVKVESEYAAEGRRLREMQEFNEFAALVMQDPTANKRYVLKRMAKMRKFPKDEIDRMFPPTPDELNALRENDILSENKLEDDMRGEKVYVKSTDNHIVHLEMHAMASDTPASRAHIYAHKEAVRLQQARPDLFPTGQPEQGMAPGESAGVATAAPGGGIAAAPSPSQLAAPIQ